MSCPVRPSLLLWSAVGLLAAMEPAHDDPLRSGPTPASDARRDALPPELAAAIRAMEIEVARLRAAQESARAATAATAAVANPPPPPPPTTVVAAETSPTPTPAPVPTRARPRGPLATTRTQLAAEVDAATARLHAQADDPPVTLYPHVDYVPPDIALVQQRGLAYLLDPDPTVAQRYLQVIAQHTANLTATQLRALIDTPISTIAPQPTPADLQHYQDRQAQFLLTELRWLYDLGDPAHPGWDLTLRQRLAAQLPPLNRQDLAAHCVALYARRYAGPLPPAVRAALPPPR